MSLRVLQVPILSHRHTSHLKILLHRMMQAQVKPMTKRCQSRQWSPPCTGTRHIISSTTILSITGTPSTTTCLMFHNTRCIPPTHMLLRSTTSNNTHVISSDVVVFFCSCFGIHTYTAIHARFNAYDLDVLRPQQLPSQTSCCSNAFLTLLMLFYLCFFYCNASRVLDMILACWHCCC